jgi:hypothetical protein
MISDKSIPGEIVRHDLGWNKQTVPPRNILVDNILSDFFLVRQYG